MFNHWADASRAVAYPSRELMPSPWAARTLGRVGRVPALHRAPPAGVPMLSCPPSLGEGSVDSDSTAPRTGLDTVSRLQDHCSHPPSVRRASDIAPESRRSGVSSRRSQPKTPGSERSRDDALF